MATAQFKKLFEPVKIGNMQLKNRIVFPPIGTSYSAAQGYVSQRGMDYLETFARGGAGLVIHGVVCPDVRYKSGENQVSLYDDSYIAGFRKLADLMHKYGAKFAIQLQLSGREVRRPRPGYQIVAPSAVPIPQRGIPHALTIGEIEEIVQNFGSAAKRAREAGADGVEIHGAHGYLIASFLSSATNIRDDKYGGSVENKARFLVEIIQSVKKAAGADFPVWARLNGREFGVENGVTIDETKKVAQMTVAAGADAVHISAFGVGDYSMIAPIPDTPGI
ncbi:MAG: NADH:flavin oxidoreductase, partial [Dehalococcoidales bacterium]|nr:NADH:flavin oxidoreductase [Dehalococcoidales bacterium]